MRLRRPHLTAWWWVHSIVCCVAGGLVLAALGGFLDFFFLPWFIVGCSLFVLLDAFGTFWFLFCTARCVTFDDQGVAVEWNSERKTVVPWDAIRVAQETSDLYGKNRKWTFECPEGNFVL